MSCLLASSMAHPEGVLSCAGDLFELPHQAALLFLPVPGLRPRRPRLCGEHAADSLHGARHGDDHLQPRRCLRIVVLGADLDQHHRLAQRATRSCGGWYMLYHTARHVLAWRAQIQSYSVDSGKHTFCAESLSSSTTVYNRNGGLKSYVLLHKHEVCLHRVSMCESI